MKKAVTLIEIMLAVVIFSMVCLMLYGMLRSGISLRKAVDRQQTGFFDIEFVFNGIVKDIRNTVRQKSGSSISGDSDGIDLLCIRKDHITGVKKIYQMKYYRYLDQMKVRISGADGKRAKEFVCIENIKDLQFEYMDKEKAWIRKWKPGTESPAAVKLRLVLESAAGSEQVYTREIFFSYE